MYSSHRLTLDPCDILSSDSKEVFRMNLDVCGSSWITIERLPDFLCDYAHEHFQSMFDLHPNAVWRQKKERNSDASDGNEMTEANDKAGSGVGGGFAVDEAEIEAEAADGLCSVIVHNRDVSAHRWYQSYLNTPVYDAKLNDNTSYMFASLQSVRDGKFNDCRQSLPNYYQPFLIWINRTFQEQQINTLQQQSEKEKEKEKEEEMKIENNLSQNLLSYNQVVANYYKNGNHFLSAHSDWHLHHVSNQYHPCHNIATITLNAPVSAPVTVTKHTTGTMSDNPTEIVTEKEKEKEMGKEKERETASQCRTFDIIPKNAYLTSACYKKLSIITRHGCVIKMYGRTQDKFLHGIPRVNESDNESENGNGKENENGQATDKVLPRISLTFRIFDEQQQH